MSDLQLRPPILVKQKSLSQASKLLVSAPPWLQSGTFGRKLSRRSPPTSSALPATAVGRSGLANPARIDWDADRECSSHCHFEEAVLFTMDPYSGESLQIPDPQPSPTRVQASLSCMRKLVNAKHVSLPEGAGVAGLVVTFVFA